MKNGFEINKCGDKVWWENGRFHKEGAPAIEWADGAESWYIDGNLHRLDGPAIITSNGNKKWYINDEYINVKSQKEFEQYLRLLAFQ
jgi:hypothetical protein